VAGALGAAIGARFLQEGWARGVPGGRGLEVTASGRRALLDIWGVPHESLAA
jgi:hypothetical protein